MMQRVAASDIVIADISSRDSNVLYELGIRHALRPRRTLAITSGPASIPFDLAALRIFHYNADRLFDFVRDLGEALKGIASSEATDSPVYLLLSNLIPPPIANLQVVPLEFRDAVERVSQSRSTGDLGLLAAEVSKMGWGIEAFRIIGKAQLSLRDLEGARETWENIRSADSMDVEANATLGTIYQRLKQLKHSNEAIQRVLTSPNITPGDRAEALALQGRNAKDDWMTFWRAKTAEHRRQAALESPLLADSFEAYYRAFKEDLNHYYSGLNALSLLLVRLQLAAALPNVWEDQFGSEIEAKAAVSSLTDDSRQLVGAVRLSIDAATDRIAREGRQDRWLEISRADLAFMTGDRPARIVLTYQRAFRGASEFEIESARRQLVYYRELGLFPDRTSEVLEAIGTPTLPAPVSTNATQLARVILFTGHMIDAPGRPTSRFPAIMEITAREAIRQAVLNEKNLTTGNLLGMSGASNGGDILFHEVCHENGIETEAYLAVPEQQYIVQSVAPANEHWIERFWEVRNSSVKVRVLQQTEELPPWLGSRKEYNVWQRNNLWLLYNALAMHVDTTLIALWNGERGDAPGGTQDMIAKAQAKGVKVIILDTRKLFGLA
jgi:hypothetical protein